MIYAGFTYLTASILYTGISTPITSILPNLSNDSYERTKLNSFRMIGGNVGYFITATFTLTLVSVLGQGNRQRGFFCTVLIYAVVSAAMFFFAFKNTKEVNMEDADKSLPIKDCFKALKSNWPWVIVVIGSMFYWLGNSTRTSSLIYYSRYYLKNESYVSILNALVLTQMIGVVAIPFLTKKLSKTVTMILGFLIASGGQIMLGISGKHFVFILVAWVITSIGTGMGDFIPLKLLQHFGYVANQEQTAGALTAMKFGFSYLPAIFFITGAIVMLFYIRFEKQEKAVLKELEMRRERMQREQK